LPPGAVDRVVFRRNHVEGKFAPELGDRLLLGVPAGDKGEEGRQAQRKVRRQDVILEVAVVRGEDIELISSWKSRGLRYWTWRRWSMTRMA
jgi:hypothetical protein